MSAINFTQSTFSREFIINRIREATATLHIKLENTELSKRMMQSDAGLSTYVSYLLAMRSVIDTTEQHVFPLATTIVEDSSERYKMHLIDQDLKALGVAGPPTSIPVFKDLSEKINNEATALGFLYVTEGSTLGGLYIAKQWKGKEGINDALSFFSVYGKETAKRWHSFVDYLTAFAITEERLSDICKGAVYAFESIHHHFETIDT